MFVQHMLVGARGRRRHGRHRHAARRAVPRRRRTRHPHRPARRRPPRGRHRPGAQPVLRHRHPRLHPGPARPGHQAAGTRRARCCSSTPTPSSPPGGRRTTCSPSTSRRSSPPTRRSPTSPATPRSSPATSCAANDDNLNIRRYADNAPPPEPHDVRAHLHGGVPRGRGRRQGGPVHRARLFARTGLRRPRRRLPRLRSRGDPKQT